MFVLNVLTAMFGIKCGLWINKRASIWATIWNHLPVTCLVSYLCVAHNYLSNRPKRLLQQNLKLLTAEPGCIHSLKDQF